MTYTEARYLADTIITKLAPVCDKIKICGSIRRKQKEVSDVDIVVLPRRTPVKDMFGEISGFIVIPEFVLAINQWEKIKGDPLGKYTQRLVDGHKVEISITTPENYGNIVAIRTGNSDFTHLLMIRALKLGLQQRDGFLWNDSKLIPCPTEEEYFRVLNLPYIEPENRNANSFKK